MSLSFREYLVSLVKCPVCRASVSPDRDHLVCPACNRDFPFVREVLRFIDSEQYADTFGYQWQAYPRTQLMPEVSERHFRKKTGLREEDLRGKLVLDVGCGTGRFADVATRWGAKVVGIDLSQACEVAARNLAGRDFVAMQADVFSLPFAPETFDCIYSIGVLHHTPNCEAAFKLLPQYLKPGGSIGIWLYSAYNGWYRFSDQYRKITHRIPVRHLHAFLRVAVPSSYWTQRGLRRLPIVGKGLASVVNQVFPISPLANPHIRVLDTLDWYSPKYQSKHTYEQVWRWFEACGLNELRIGEVPVSICGRKPNLQLGLMPRNSAQNLSVS